MALKLNTGLFIRICLAFGAVGGGGYALKSFFESVDKNDAASAASRAASEAASNFNENINSGVEDKTEYSIVGTNTLRVTEGGVIYRFNFASEIVTVRSDLQDSQRTDQVAVMSFNQLANPTYIKNIKSIGCQIAQDLAPKTMKENDLKSYPDDWQAEIKSTYGMVVKFGELHCKAD